MENEDSSQLEKVNKFEQLHKVTPLSKYLALALFVLLPFIGGWVGYQYAPNKVIEVEKEIGKSCNIDTDCALIQPDCEDCTFDSISKDEISLFQAQKQNRCTLNPPKVMCDIVYTGSVKCIDNTCQLSD